jgi:hypothetical protein
VKLERFFDRIVSCHIVTEAEGHHRHSGDRFRFSIHIGLPGHEILEAPPVVVSSDELLSSSPLFGSVRSVSPPSGRAFKSCCAPQT